jgi:hypothetical protein
MEEEAQSTNRPVSIVEIGVPFFCVYCLSVVVFNGVVFSHFWTGLSLASLAILLSLYYLLRRQTGPSILCAVIAVMIGALNAPTVPTMFPLRHAVGPLVLKDVALADALHQIAQSKDDAPRWRFSVSDEELAHTQVSLTLSAETSLAEALDSLMAESGASYTWNWRHHSGRPICAHFFVSRDASRDHSEYEVLISSFGIHEEAVGNDERGMADP